MTTSNAYFSSRDAARGDEAPQVVFVDGKVRTSLSKAAFWQAVETEAARLAECGVVAGDVVLAFSRNAIAPLVFFFACQRLGAIPSLMPPQSPRQPSDAYFAVHKALVERIRPRLVLGEPEQAAVLAEAFDCTVEPLSDPASLAGRDARLDAPLPAGDTIALLQHSSGTTGLKKGVMLDYDLLVRHLTAVREATGLEADTTIVSWLPLYHDMGLIACALLPVVCSHKLVMMETFDWLADPLQILRLAAEEPSAVLWLPNFAFAHLANHARRLRSPLDLSRVHAIINCSEPCKPDTMERFLETFAPHGLRREAIQASYGMAENVFAITQTAVRRPLRTLHIERAAYERGKVSVVGGGTVGADEPVIEGAVAFASCGSAIAGTEMQLRRDDGTPAAPNEVGRLFIRGTSLFQGYYEQPALSAERFHGEWFDTTDLGFFHEGEFFVSGRIDDLIIVNGKNLIAHDIENTANQVAGIKPGRVSAFGCDDARTGSQVLVIAAEVPDRDDEEKVRERIYQLVFGEFGVAPADILLAPVDTLLKTTSGKMSRSENRKRYVAGKLTSWREDAA